MKRKDFKKFLVHHRTNHIKTCVVPDKSVTDPSFAQSGRQQIFNPLPINYRVTYADGVPLNKENPMQFNEFDKLYPDRFKAVEQAKAQVDTTKTHLTKIKEHLNKKPDTPTNQPNNNPQN